MKESRPAAGNDDIQDDDDNFKDGSDRGRSNVKDNNNYSLEERHHMLHTCCCMQFQKVCYQTCIVAIIARLFQEVLVAVTMHCYKRSDLAPWGLLRDTSLTAYHCALLLPSQPYPNFMAIHYEYILDEMHNSFACFDFEHNTLCTKTMSSRCALASVDQSAKLTCLRMDGSL